MGVRIAKEHWCFLAPVRPGFRLTREDVLVDVIEAAPVESEGDSFQVIQRSTWRHDGNVVGWRERHRAHGPSPMTDPPTNAARPARANYTPEQLEDIGRAYDAESRRGPSTRTSDEVSAGDVLPTIVRGPLTVADLITYRAAVGAGPIHSGALRLGHESRKRHPHLYSPDPSGTPETIERLHWDDAYAQSQGHPAPYDYSHTRSVWVGQLLTDWAGDGAWISDLTVETTAANYVGDCQWLEGEVRSTTAIEGGSAVEVEARAINQRGAVTYRALATVLLPARSNGVLPTTGATGEG
jgi:hypothetical protein